MSPDKKLAIGIADFILCWCALCGMANVAGRIVYFNNTEIKMQLFGRPVETTAQRLTGIAIYTLIAGIGFTYMLWRYHWRFRLSTLLKIAVVWFLMLAAYATNAIIATLFFAFSVFSYTLYWAFLPKGLPEQKD